MGLFFAAVSAWLSANSLQVNLGAFWQRRIHRRAANAVSTLPRTNPLNATVIHVFERTAMRPRSTQLEGHAVPDYFSSAGPFAARQSGAVRHTAACRSAGRL